MKLTSVMIGKALGYGWQADMSVNERRVFECVAFNGMPSKLSGMAFSWEVRFGVSSWANYINMPRPSMYRVLDSLCVRGLFEHVQEGGQEHYAIPTQVVEECVTYITETRYIRLTGETNCLMGETNLSHGRDSDEPVTRANDPYKQEEKQEESTNSKESEQRAARVVDGKRILKRRTEVDDFYEKPEEPLEGRATTPAKRQAPTTRLAELFNNEWMKLREEPRFTDVAAPWDSKKAFLGKMKELLDTYTEEQLSCMIGHFFAQLRGGDLYSGEKRELWRVFMSNRSKLSTTWKQPVVRKSDPNEKKVRLTQR